MSSECLIHRRVKLCGTTDGAEAVIQKGVADFKEHCIIFLKNANILDVMSRSKGKFQLLYIHLRWFFKETDQFWWVKMEYMPWVSGVNSCQF